MSMINLLPWREEQKKINNRIFIAFLTGLLVFSMGIILLTKQGLHLLVKREAKKTSTLQVKHQQQSQETKKKESLEKKKKDIVHRIAIINEIQSDKWTLIKLLDTLPRIVPDGVYLTEMERFGQHIFIYGNAQTNASISILLKNMEEEKGSSIFQQVKVIEVSPDKNNAGLYFKLGFLLKQKT